MHLKSENWKLKTKWKVFSIQFQIFITSWFEWKFHRMRIFFFSFLRAEPCSHSIWIVIWLPKLFGIPLVECRQWNFFYSLFGLIYWYALHFIGEVEKKKNFKGNCFEFNSTFMNCMRNPGVLPVRFRISFWIEPIRFDSIQFHLRRCDYEL